MYALDEALETALVELAKKEQRQAEELHIDLVTTALVPSGLRPQVLLKKEKILHFDPHTDFLDQAHRAQTILPSPAQFRRGIFHK
jgi:hypothetical protein